MIFLWKLLPWGGESLKVSVERDEKKKQLEKTNCRIRTQDSAGKAAESEDKNGFGVEEN